MASEHGIATVGGTGIRVDGDQVTVAWRGRPLLRGRLCVDPVARGMHLTARGDDESVYVEAHVEPLPTAPIVAAWLDLHWIADGVEPACSWVPHLRPEHDHVIADHAFRSPVAAIGNRDVRVLLLPDVDLLTTARALPGAFDLDVTDRQGPRIAYGLCASKPDRHTWFRRDPAAGTTQPLRFAVRIVAEAATERPIESSSARWAWQTCGAPRAAHARTQALPFAEHAERAYAAAFVDEWLETQIGATPVGGPIHYSDRGTAVFFQAWYNALRSAIGLALLGKRHARADHVARARRVAALIDAMPAHDLLPTFYDHEQRRWWGVGDDLIFTWGTRDESVLRFHHLPDACETAKWMIVWHEQVEARPSFVTRVRRLARFLASAQADDGSIPSYFDQRTLEPGPRLRSVAQSAIAGPLLLYAGEQLAAVRLAEFLCREVVPSRRYFDYETFLSCSYKPFDFADPYTRIPPQNTLSIGWTAECLLALARSTLGSPEQRTRWLASARQALDQLCLYQQLWEPPFLSYRAFGGFGVMNTDGEWSDARQALYGLLLLDAYQTFGAPEYFLRGVAALRAGFALQAIPENREICPTIYDGACPNWPRAAGWDFRFDHPAAAMNKMPAGKMVENYGHGGFDSPGVRSGFDWGEGSAAACALLATERFGEVFVDANRNQAFGIDGVNAVREQDALAIEDVVGQARRLHVRVRTQGGVQPADTIQIAPGATVRL